VESNERQGVQYRQPRSLSERAEVARTCAEQLGLTAPLLLDEMDNRADRAYGAWPERLYVIGRGGEVAYQGGKGPYGFSPADLEQFLHRYMGEA
jgi:hypothetical protein